jgi:MurNAc alpha-1-phosphate uridylyltransferase
MIPKNGNRFSDKIMHMQNDMNPSPAKSPKSAMVLSAGLGTRMRPLTERMPKPLVEVGGKPLIDHVLDRLVEAGVERAVVNVHHFAEQLERHLASRKTPRIVISDERGLLLGTGGAAVKALPQLGDAPFFHINSDTIWIDGVRPNLARLAETFDAAVMDALLLLAPTTGSIGYAGRGDFAFAPDGRLTRRAERAVAPFVFARRIPAASVVRPRRGTGPFVRPAAGRPVDACRQPRRHRAGGKRHKGQYGLIGGTRKRV